MGSSSSKPDASELALPTSSSSGVRRSRSKGSKVFQSSCLGSQSGSHESERDEQIKENGFHGPSANQNKSEAHQVKAECYSKVKAEQPDETACISSSNEYDEWGQSNLSDLDSRAGSSSSRAFSTRSLDPPSRSLSCFKFFPGNSSCRLSRATSLGSSRADPPSSSSFTVSNEEEQHHVHVDPARGSNLRDDQITSALNVVARDADNPRGEFNVNLFSLRNHTDVESMETTRLADRRIGAREPVERNVRFSRTLISLGGTQALGGGTGLLASNENALISSSPSIYASSGMPSSFYSSQDSEVETSRARDTRYHDLLEHRSNFLERRRRIRSQVLDEIHQQSVVLSSQPSVSPIGSVPAPIEVVESLPVKLYSKSQKHLNEEAAQ
ncbi:RING/U-box superfamily protein [Actinidia rufa]|uniref:RING/U-box superfamily protein n=1 Tax=Actinidia rufa TaxID=165716 RepID=A0A7J0GZX1_9ERIC|nr:RING/U-box superfamily protein [Actinidia rufa]